MAFGKLGNFAEYFSKLRNFKGGLADILEMFFQRAKNSAPDSAAPDWPDAKGPSYKDVRRLPERPKRNPYVWAEGLSAFYFRESGKEIFFSCLELS